MENDLKNAEKLIIEQRFKKFFLLLFGITAMKNAEISRDVKKKKEEERNNMEENNAQRSIRIRIVVTRSLLAFHRVCTFSSLFFRRSRVNMTRGRKLFTLMPVYRT